MPVYISMWAWIRFVFKAEWELFMYKRISCYVVDVYASKSCQRRRKQQCGDNLLEIAAKLLKIIHSEVLRKKSNTNNTRQAIFEAERKTKRVFPKTFVR